MSNKLDVLFPYLEVTEDEIQQAKLDYAEYPRDVWDPVNHFNIEHIRTGSAKIIAKIRKLKQYPGRPKRQLTRGIITGSVILVSAAFPAFYFLGTDEGIIVSLIFLGLTGMIAGFIYTFYRKLGIDLVNIFVATEKKWYYHPDEDTDKWERLNKQFPEIFNRGCKPYIEDQFWGKFARKKKMFDFFSGLFHYTIVTSDSKGKKSETQYTKNFFSLKLDTPVRDRFYLFTGGTGAERAKIPVFSVQTESIEFNKYFSVSYDAQNENILPRVNNFSPAFLVSLTDIMRAKGAFGVLITENCLFFIFNGEFYKRTKTDFFREVKIHPSDIEYFDEQLFRMIDLTTEFVKHLS